MQQAKIDPEKMQQRAQWLRNLLVAHKQKYRPNVGFSLLELLVVLGIVASLTLLASTQWQNHVARADSVIQQQLLFELASLLHTTTEPITNCRQWLAEQRSRVAAVGLNIECQQSATERFVIEAQALEQQAIREYRLSSNGQLDVLTAQPNESLAPNAYAP